MELQFLLLNDFNLVIPLEEMQRYADQLLVYWDNKQKGVIGVGPDSKVMTTTAAPSSGLDNHQQQGKQKKEDERVTSGSGEKRKRDVSASNSPVDGVKSEQDGNRAGPIGNEGPDVVMQDGKEPVVENQQAVEEVS